MGLTREEASDLLETIPPERVARIEYEQFCSIRTKFY